ncbi:MAG: hypothetical protein LUH51_00750 [Firmicutes bacterium]|nr:hypothetical protein [Bacillota bacterium]
MGKAFLAGFRQGIWPRLLLSALVFAIASATACTDTIVMLSRNFHTQSPGYHLILLRTALNSDAALMFLPIAAALPFAGSYVDEVKTKYVRLMLCRTGYAGYLLSRALICFVTGCLVIIGGALLLWLVSVAVFCGVETGEGSYELLRGPVALRAGLLALSGGVWALLGMSFSAWMESKYIAYAAPFVFYYVLRILYERYFSALTVLDSSAWVNPDAGFPGGAWGNAALLLALAVLFSLPFLLRARKRVKNL